jgi:hypothetical protein
MAYERCTPMGDARLWEIHVYEAALGETVPLGLSVCLGGAALAHRLSSL